MKPIHYAIFPTVVIMRKLDDSERGKILKTLEPLVASKNAKAICVYGSQVSGYARPESDYDVILVLAPFRQKIKYNYLKGEVDCSALVIDSKSFENDCVKSTFGEFVAGRLLNPFESLQGSEFFYENEVKFKRRVIIEGLVDCYAEYARFTEDIEFPLKYFLFEKLRKRAAIYPPVVYSYSKTYGGEFLAENLGQSLKAFRAAAVTLEEDAIVRYDKDRDIVKLRDSRFKAGIGAKISSTASYTARGLRQYAIHGYAGRVGLDVVGKEVVSKLSRATKNHSELPDWIKEPKSAWSLSNAKLFSKSSDWLSDFISESGMERASTIVSKKSLGEIYTSTTFYKLSDESSRKTLHIAVKRFTDVTGMKWGLLNVWSLRNTNFTANSVERLHREYSANSFFKSIGIPTSEILAIFASEKTMISRFINGTDLSTLQADYLDGRSDDLSTQVAFGATLAKAHMAGYCVGDTKPSNAILSLGSLYLTDLEQAHAGGNRIWDIAEFIFYSVRFTLKEERARKLIESFVSGYLNSGGDRKVIEEAAALRYRAPFQAFIAPNVLSSLRKDLSKIG
jgi:tRNA A-37 threonylcarbamoyl transferase component Bud32/predicted nucleotidyltransferase